MLKKNLTIKNKRNIFIKLGRRIIDNSIAKNLVALIQNNPDKYFIDHNAWVKAQAAMKEFSLT